MAQAAEDDPATETRRDVDLAERERAESAVSSRETGTEPADAGTEQPRRPTREREEKLDSTPVQPGEAEPRPEAVADQKPEPKRKPPAKPEPEPEREPQHDPKPEPEREPESKPEPTVESSAADAAETKTPEEVEPKSAASAPSRPPIRRGGSLLERSPPPPPPVPPPRQIAAADPEPDKDAQDYEPGEILLVSADMAEAQSAARQLQAYQLRVKSRQRLGNLGLVLSVFRLPPGDSAPALMARLQTELPDLNLDTNQRYQALNARRRYAYRLIAWPDPIGSCHRDFRIGMLDAPVADKHPALVNAALVRRNFVRGEAASPVHGTAVASLLIGEPGSPAPGLLPGSRLFAAEVFRQRGETTDTTTDTLLAALDWLAGRDVQAINLSLGGEHNRVFELTLERLLERDIRLVAAAGNRGPDAPPVFPAAQPGVIAVTAVDAVERLYPDANRGDYIDLAAPGVDIWAADGEAPGRYHTGTSFAAPFVTAALLLADHRGVDLTGTVKDLGPEGRDDRFGWGLVQVAGGCR
ncbi:S8 family serine peptidase [Microbulbifer sp.]|uniref:S8 family serine peptidase n=1 Tax=Microbulbifer sp. TaxID=1908541 RepID=UPI003F40BC50